jgi:hypothetical protein
MRWSVRRLADADGGLPTQRTDTPARLVHPAQSSNESLRRHWLVSCVIHEPKSIDFAKLVQAHEEEDAVSAPDLLQPRSRWLAED